DPDDDKNIATADEDGAKTKKSKIASNKKIKIPNFEKFRLKLLLGGGALIVILIATYVANFVLPKAKIIVSTDDISVNTNISFTANVNVSNLDVDKAIAPAVSSEVSKTDTEKVTATGKKNVGEKAVGTVSLELSDCSSKKVTVPSGTTVTDNDLSFVTQKEITFYSVPVGDDCLNSDLPAYSTGTVKVVAKEPGDQYNINGGRKFRVEGFTGVKGTDSSAMTGGTTKEITIVSDQDIETAKQKLADKSKETANSELAKKLKEQNLIPIIETFTAGAPSVSASPEVGSESADTTVTSVVSYKMLGVKREYIKTLVTNNAKTQIDVSKQSIQNDGIDKAVYRVTNKSSADIQVISLQAVVSTGTEVDEEALKKELVGKKKGEIQQLIGNRPGVKEVDVQYSPFWVYKTPKNPNKIHFEFKQIGNASD
ncbi:hypothetical protein KDA11_03225, partial [Candidatus Saccharibacteria bacterium]|nr:hypothetical protein [Candidatus Saccharibacteria bacterium]